ncbi:glycosyltransferase [Candidatus Parcubacteria bacterium]|nr:MAG: glycosyltransferase [Candidatus Parcubacteria bacterium]
MPNSDANAIARLDLSVVVPFFNEEESLPRLHARLCKALGRMPMTWELIFVDDGSTDGTAAAAERCAPLHFIRLRENYGQTAALAAGIHASRGRIIVTLDGDLENDPDDIPSLLEKFAEGYDVVSGWRRDRWRDHLFTRRIPSMLANTLISWVSGVRLHDHGCPLKVYRRDRIVSLAFIGDMHRMMAVHAGGRIAEVPIRFSPRQFGTSKYGFSRTFKVVLDVFAHYFFRRFRSRPMHFFGWFGFWSLAASALTFAVMVWLKYGEGKSFVATPLPAVAVLFAIIGVQFILMGLFAEMLIRTQYAATQKPFYVVESVHERSAP